ncbi:hypothetical protein ACIGDI_26685 [Streptomyces sp. NPDC085900]|uniref:hypothetical protein n=1 Tax=Streptomyces sp. NPDC085900 TaxID=3365737 RepID=UPI0037CF9DF0
MPEPVTYRQGVDRPDAGRVGAERALYCARLPLRADRSPAHAPGGSRDPALDECQDVVGEWLRCAASSDRKA